MQLYFIYLKKWPRVGDGHTIFLGLGSRLDSALSCSPIIIFIKLKRGGKKENER